MDVIGILFQASVNTIVLTALTLAISTALAAMIAPLATSRFRIVRVVIVVYTWLGRSIPELIFVYFAFYGLFQIGIDLPPLPSVLLAFVTFSTAFNLEIFRGGLKGVPAGQYDAVKALGLPRVRAYFGVVLPQMVRIVMPSYLTNATSILKATSLASLVTVTEVSALAGRLVGGNPQFALEILLQAALVYLVLCSVLLTVQAVLARRWSAGRRHAIL
ncbi:amino acid ABC transporter permease [Microbacterium sp. 18062]|uniref:amino acid ABC transporter permease n=1 Tax=Microbacterium sp. 18062 TaxID=2681410 RepID=UPI00135830C1|nr:ABC transporter permease subunit [Microbacterium sp. 18062]